MYDVFISYSHVQREWVRGQLLPRLEEEGLKVIIDDRDFEIGVPSLVNMERAVDNSRHTLVVLTPAWLASEWTEFESLLVGITDPAARRRKVIPLLLEACKLPPRLAILTFADFTQPPERNAQMSRLVKSLSTQSKGDAAPTAIERAPKPIIDFCVRRRLLPLLHQLTAAQNPKLYQEVFVELPTGYTDADLEVHLAHVRDAFALLDLRGMSGASQALSIPLEQVYVELQAEADNPSERDYDRLLFEQDVREQLELL
jgi:hypothetical protein